MLSTQGKKYLDKSIEERKSDFKCNFRSRILETDFRIYEMSNLETEAGSTEI